jgi:putative iron-only hydrogenase system regulator
MSKKYAVVGMLVNRRKKAAPLVQYVLTDFGDSIIGRMGLPEGHGHDHEDGLITLTMHAEDRDIKEMVTQLNTIEGVVVNAATIVRAE